jgi:FAD/FMN-containing dehydrogenase
MTMADPDWAALRSSVAGDVVTAADPEYDDLRRPAIANFHDVLPRAVVRCATPSDVAETLAFADRFGLPLVPRSGGHCFAGRSSTEGVVVDVSPMSSISVSDSVASVGAGCRLGAIYDALTAERVTIPAGCGATVGIAGLVLGGGLGVLGRTYGLTSDRLVAAEVVLADGRIVRADQNNEPDLFWALRGAGGGRFGVVTSLDIATVSMPAMTTFHLTWPQSDAVAVAEAWQEWAPKAPDPIAASLLLRAEGDTGEPATVNVFGAAISSESDTTAQLDEFVARAGAEPATIVTAEASYPEAKRWLATRFPGDEGDLHLHSKSEFFGRPLPRDTLGSLNDRLGDGRLPGETRILDFSPWGGAYGRTRPDATAFAHRDAKFLLKQEVAVRPESQDPARRWLRSSWSTAHPWGTGGVYPNFPDPDLDEWDVAYHGPNLDRLRRIKAAYDPTGRFG